MGRPTYELRILLPLFAECLVIIPRQHSSPGGRKIPIYKYDFINNVTPVGWCTTGWLATLSYFHQPKYCVCICVCVCVCVYVGV